MSTVRAKCYMLSPELVAISQNGMDAMVTWSQLEERLRGKEGQGKSPESGFSDSVRGRVDPGHQEVIKWRQRSH